MPAGLLPPGFLALDLGRALGLPVWEPNGLDISVTGHPQHASAVLGRDARRPDIAIGANGGSDAIWLLTPRRPGDGAPDRRRAEPAGLHRRSLRRRPSSARSPAPCPFGAVGLEGGARTPRPDLLVSFRSYPLGCARPLLCGIDVADTDLQQGQGIHGGFGRADTRNMMAAIGPDFRRGYVDPSPVANSDWAPTLAHVLGLRLAGHGALRGRVMTTRRSHGARTAAASDGAAGQLDAPPPTASPPSWTWRRCAAARPTPPPRARRGARSACARAADRASRKRRSTAAQT